ncbi:hypothetical protein [Paracoccus sp. JM45]|uniref:hypothetical protein n=1 Tax=Paracoccus sp. JM45 TaxID=2283626 RepID=UPI000E6D0366|nr:hypothetical protein [Paracoccus sp. JM45]RJE78696.1 hypothetical protein DWB67_16325 [Paracoccus sp. JM45]
MSVDVSPGGFRIGVLNVQKNGLQESAWQELTPKFQLLILLIGRHIFEIGSRCFDMDARDHPSALLMVIRSETLLRHIESAGHPYHKLASAVPLKWAANIDILPRAMQGDDNWFRQWCQNRETIELATQIIAPPPW